MTDLLVLVAIPPAVGVVIGYVRGGKLGCILDTRLRAIWLLAIAAGLRVILFHVEPVRRFVLETVGVPLRAPLYAVVLTWCALNARRFPKRARPWITVGVVGVIANALPILLNGRMPYVGEAARLAGIPDTGTDIRVPPAASDTKLVTLADVIPVPGIHAVLSIGDLLLMTAIAATVAMLMHEGNQNPQPQPSPSGPSGDPAPGSATTSAPSTG